MIIEFRAKGVLLLIPLMNTLLICGTPKLKGSLYLIGVAIIILSWLIGLTGEDVTRRVAVILLFVNAGIIELAVNKFPAAGIVINLFSIVMACIFYLGVYRERQTSGILIDFDNRHERTYGDDFTYTPPAPPPPLRQPVDVDHPQNIDF